MRPLRIAFDSRWLLQAENHPHAALFKALLRANAEQPFDAELWLLTSGAPIEVPWTRTDNVTVRIVPSTSPQLRGAEDFWWQTKDAWPVAKRGGAELFVSPFYKVPLLPGIRRVNMIHDTSIFRVPKEMIGAKYDQRWRREVLRASLKGSAALAVRTLTVSRHSKRCLVEDLDLSPSRVGVCYHGVDALPPTAMGRARAKLSANRALPADYVLFVGANIVKKNVDGLLRAWAKVPSDLRARHPLLLKTYGEESIRAAALQLGVTDTVHVLHAHLTEEEMFALYGGARALVLPSYDEGFGLPVAEAMAHGVPVVVSAGGAMEEIAGADAILFNPASVDDIARGVTTVLRWSAAEHALHAERARERAATFSVRRAADVLFDELRQAADIRPRAG